MNIHHCLFWIQNKMVTSIIFRNGSMEIMEFDGYNSKPFNDAYWDEWSEYRGFCSEDRADFCFVYDEEPKTLGKLEGKGCYLSDTIWCANKIQHALNILNINAPTEIRTETGKVVCKIGAFRNISDEEKIVMTACYANAASEEAEIKKESSETTPFIRGMIRLLNKMDEENDRR